MRLLRSLLLLIVLWSAGALIAGCGRSSPAPAGSVGPAIAPATPVATTATPQPAPAAPVLPAPRTPAPLPSPVSSTAIDRGDPSAPEIALVINFGAGYSPAPEILDILQEARVPATFMIMGWIARERPDLVRTIAIGGFEIGSHGDQVPDLTLVSDGEVAADLQAADQTLSTLIGHSTRPLWSPSAGAQDARVRRVAAGLGYRTLLWTVDSGDWRTDASTAFVERLVLPHLANGTIVVLHFDSPHSRDATVPALKDIIAALHQDGLRPVTMSALLAHRDQGTSGP